MSEIEDIQEEAPRNPIIIRFTGADPWYVFSGNTLVATLENPGDQFGYFIEDGLDITISTTPRDDE